MRGRHQPAARPREESGIGKSPRREGLGKAVGGFRTGYEDQVPQPKGHSHTALVCLEDCPANVRGGPGTPPSPRGWRAAEVNTFAWLQGDFCDTGRSRRFGPSEKGRGVDRAPEFVSPTLPGQMVVLSIFRRCYFREKKEGGTRILTSSSSLRKAYNAFLLGRL